MNYIFRKLHDSAGCLQLEDHAAPAGVSTPPSHPSLHQILHNKSRLFSHNTSDSSPGYVNNNHHNN